VASLQEFEGADVRFGSVSDMESLTSTAFSSPVDVVVSCLASRTGGKVSSTLSWMLLILIRNPSPLMEVRWKRGGGTVCVPYFFPPYGKADA